jgi:hypothetical protein
MTELKPCPFCGGIPQLQPNLIFIRCDACNVELGESESWKADVIEKWNTRSLDLPSELRKAFEAGVHVNEMGIDYENGESVGGAFDSWLRSRIEKGSE